MRYTELPKQDQPAQRIREVGPSALSASEALALALWIPDVQAAHELSRLYEHHGSLRAIPRDQIVAIKGLGPRYADAVAAVSDLVRRETNRLYTRQDNRKTISSPDDAAALVQYEMADLDHEELWVILVDTRNNVKRIVKLYSGSVNSSQIRVCELFRDAIRDQASCIILAHNHPSGDPTPSPDDVAVTKAAVAAGKMMDIDVLDHIVIGKGRYASLKQRGLGFA